MPLTIIIDAQGQLQRLVRANQSLLSSTEAANVVGFGGAQAWRGHLYDKDKKPNKLGGAKTHFWAQAAGAVHHTTQGKDAVVTSAKRGVRQRWKGGTIHAKPGKMLTIPMHPKAHGKRAGEIGGLSLIKSGKGVGAQLLLAKTKDGDPEIEVYYLLKSSVYQAPDPDVVNEAEILGGGKRGLLDLIRANNAVASGQYK